MMTEDRLPPGPCLNCGVQVDQSYCPNCGQERTKSVVPVDHLLREVIDEFLVVDAKLVRTLTPLLCRPGFLTQEYIAGRRARYLGPFRLYFIISALYFLAFSFAHYDVAVMRGLAYGLEQAHHAHIAHPPLSSSAADNSASKPVASMMFETHMAHDHAMVSDTHMTDAHALMPGSPTAHMNAASGGQLEDADRAQRHGFAVKRTTDWFLKNQSLLTFFLVPIAALLLKLLYIKTGKFYLEHLVFAVHLQSFLFLALLVALLPFARSITYFATLAIGGIYLYLAMRRFYGQGAITTALLCAVMLASYGVIMAGATYTAFLLFYNRILF